MKRSFIVNVLVFYVCEGMHVGDGLNPINVNLCCTSQYVKGVLQGVLGSICQGRLG